MDAAEIQTLVANIADGAAGTVHAEQAARVVSLVDALRRRFAQRSRGSLFHTLKTELATAFKALRQPGAAHAVVAVVLGSVALSVTGGGGGGGDTTTNTVAPPKQGWKSEPEKQPLDSTSFLGSKARRRERLAKARLERQRSPASASAAATPLALILLEALPPLTAARAEDGALTPTAEGVVRCGLPLLRAVLEQQLPWLRPRVVLRIIDIYGVAEGGAPIDLVAVAEAAKTQGGSGGGRATRWRKPTEEGGKLLQWPSSVWACSANDDGVATPTLPQDRAADSAAPDRASQMFKLAAGYLVRLWRDEPQEALRAVAFLLAFPTAAAMAASPGATSEAGRGLSPAGVVNSLVRTRQWAALRQLLRAAPFGKDTASEIRTLSVRALLKSGYTPQAEAVVVEFQMESEFPSVANATQRSTLQRLIKQRQWSLASDLCGHNAALRKWLIFELAANVQAPAELPLQLAQRFDLLDVKTEAKLAGVVQRRGATASVNTTGGYDGSTTQGFLQIGVMGDCVRMVDDLDGVELARTLLLRAERDEEHTGQWVVGMDAEWKPTSGGNTLETGMSRVSILQLSTRTHVVLLDMFTLLQHSEVSDEPTAAEVPSSFNNDSSLISKLQNYFDLTYDSEFVVSPAAILI